MNVETAMEEALRAGPGAVAVACADVRVGLVIGASARGDAERELAVDAASCAAELCAMPKLGGDEAEAYEEDVEDASGAVVVSSRWVHAYARVARSPELVVVGVAPGSANVALVLDWVRRVAGSLGGQGLEPC